MIVRAIDGNNDWSFGKGISDYKTGTNAIAQCIKTRLQSFLGDCFFDTGAGIDWFNRLGSKNIEALKLDVSTCILNSYGVTGLVEVSADLDDNRNLRVVYDVTVVSEVNQTTVISGSVSLLLTEDGFVLVDELGNPLEI